jgi:hypothetical protein
LNKIRRRQFIQLSAAAAAGTVVLPVPKVRAQDEMPKLTEDDPMAQAMQYVNDSSTVDPASRPNPAEDQKCSNCALIQGDSGAWRPCQIFPGKLVNENGWCSVWAPKA